jgi:hypothetical protein
MPSTVCCMLHGVCMQFCTLRVAFARRMHATLRVACCAGLVVVARRCLRLVRSADAKHLEAQPQLCNVAGRHSTSPSPHPPSPALGPQSAPRHATACCHQPKTAAPCRRHQQLPPELRARRTLATNQRRARERGSTTRARTASQAGRTRATASCTPDSTCSHQPCSPDSTCSHQPCSPDSTCSHQPCSPDSTCSHQPCTPVQPARINAPKKPHDARRAQSERPEVWCCQ